MCDASAFVDLVLGCHEETGTETERDRAAHEREAQVEEARHGSDRSADEYAGSLDDLRRSLCRRPACDLLDSRPGSLGLEASLGPTSAPSPGRLNDEMANMTSISAPSVQDPPFENDPSTYSSRHHHGQEVRLSSTGTGPGLSEGQGLGIIVDEHGDRREAS